MKVLLVNGSPHEKGCTYTALCEIADTLRDNGIDSEIFWIGTKPISGCIACLKCNELGQCVFDDAVNRCAELAAEADGFVFGSPVHFASAGGAFTAFMDRLFYSEKKGSFYLKPAAAIASARRAGTTATIDQLNKYFMIKQMPIVSSTYWNMVHGSTPDDVKQDLEGMLTMRNLARNMAWLIKCKEAGANAGVELPEREAPVRTNFIR